MDMTFRGDRLLEMSKAENPHQFSLKARVSYPTVMRYLQPDGIKILDLTVLAAMLNEGVGLTADQVREMRIGDLFTVE